MRSDDLKKKEESLYKFISLIVSGFRVCAALMSASLKLLFILHRLYLNTNKKKTCLHNFNVA